MRYLGDFATGATVRVPWMTTAADGSSITRATNGAIRIYKNTSTTERSSSAGITDTEDFDALAGVHVVSIDLADNTDAGFYAAGNDYVVVLQGAVIDGKTVNAVLAQFSIQNRYVGAGGPTAAQIADALLARSLAGGADGGRTVQDALRALRNKVTDAAGTLTVYREDDATPAWTAASTRDATAGALTGVDPA